MSSRDEHSLEKLPEILVNTTAAIPLLNKALFKASLIRATNHQDVLERYLLRRSQFNWKFHILQKEGAILLLLRKRSTGNYMVMKTVVKFSMSPTKYPTYFTEGNSIPQFISWTPPSFIITDQERINKLANQFKVDANNCLLLDMSIRKEKLLLIAFSKETGKKASFYYSTRPADSKGAFTKNMIFDFCSAFKHGIQNEFEGGNSLLLDLNKEDDGEKDKNNEIKKIIKLIYEGYWKMVFPLPPATRNKNWLQHGHLHYKVKDFMADVTLRLKDDGTLAWDYAKDNPFQMQLHLSVKEQAGLPMFQMKTFPPDFLTGGALYQKLMDAVLTPGRSSFKNIEKKFIAAGWHKETITTIFEQCREEGAVIIRVKRKRNFDTNLFVLIGKIKVGKQEHRHALVFEGKFTVHFKEGEPEVRLLRESSLKVLYDARYRPINDNHQVEEYFTKLMWFLKNWVDLVD